RRSAATRAARAARRRRRAVRRRVVGARGVHEEEAKGNEDQESVVCPHDFYLPGTVGIAPWSNRSENIYPLNVGSADVIGIIESAYRVRDDDAGWVREIAASA